LLFVLNFVAGKVLNLMYLNGSTLRPSISIFQSRFVHPERKMIIPGLVEEGCLQQKVCQSESSTRGG
jgi:hypothetical protein